MSRYIVIRANTLLFGALVAMLLVIGVASWDRFNAAESAVQWSQHTYEALGKIENLALAVREAESGQRTYLLSGDADSLEAYRAAAVRIEALQSDLNHLVADNPAQLDRLRMLAPTVQRKLEMMAQAAQARVETGFDAAQRVLQAESGMRLMQQIDGMLAAMRAEEERLLAERIAALDNRGAWLRGLLLGGAGVAIVGLLLAAQMLNEAWARSYRAEAEQRTAAIHLRVSLDSLSQGVALFGADQRLIHWNECFQILLDLPKELVCEGTPYATFVSQTTQDEVPLLETDDQVRHSRALPGEPITYERTRSDGSHLELRRTRTPDTGFVLTISDMTKRAQAEAVLRESQKMQAIGQLTGGIAHDFNNLLTVILGNLELAHTRLDGDPVLLGRVERAQWAAQRGATLTSQLLAFARKQPLAPAPVDLAATIQDLVPLLRRTIGEHIDIRYVETAGQWPAMADPAQLENALLNLALNARDAMPGGGRLTIELANKVLDEVYARSHSEVTPGDYAMLAVSDTGHGMTPEVLARAFEPFFTTKEDGKGTGLGLAMVFGFIKQSGGHLNIYSERGEGTTVRLYLPRAIGVRAGLSQQRIGTPIDLPGGSATVLVVEDEPAVREIAVAILGELGYRVLEAPDGETALLVFGANAAAIDLLLTDVVLPGRVRGRELAERVRAARPGVKVLFMSGYTENSIVHHGRLDDGVHLLSKPFKREHLARRVAEVLNISPAANEDNGLGTGNVVELNPRRGS